MYGIRVGHEKKDFCCQFSFLLKILAEYFLYLFLLPLSGGLKMCNLTRVCTRLFTNEFVALKNIVSQVVALQLPFLGFERCPFHK